MSVSKRILFSLRESPRLHRRRHPVEVRPQLARRRVAHVARHAHPIPQVAEGLHRRRRFERREVGGGGVGAGEQRVDDMAEGSVDEAPPPRSASRSGRRIGRDGRAPARARRSGRRRRGWRGGAPRLAARGVGREAGCARGWCSSSSGNGSPTRRRRRRWPRGRRRLRHRLAAAVCGGRSTCGRSRTGCGGTTAALPSRRTTLRRWATGSGGGSAAPCSTAGSAIRRGTARTCSRPT